MSSDLNSVAKGLGFKGTLPKGATDISKNPDGTYKITINGQDKTVDVNGDSVFTTKVPVDDVKTNESGSKSTTVLNNSSSNSSRAASVFSAVNGEYNIDPAWLAKSAMDTDTVLQMGKNMPFGLGGVLANGSVEEVAKSFLNAASFKFDFTEYLNLQQTKQQTESSYVSNSETVYGIVPGLTPVTDGNCDVKTIDVLAEEGGYYKTETQGVYKKGKKLYSYDVAQNKFIEIYQPEDKALKGTNKKQIPKQNKIKKEAASIAEDLYDAMKGAGTKNEKLQKTVDKINKNNVMEVLDAWNENYSDSMDGETLLQSIQDEHHAGWFGKSQEKQEKIILDALYQRAMDLGLMNEAHAARAKVNYEHDAMFTSDDTVRTAIEDLAGKIKAKEAERSL